MSLALRVRVPNRSISARQAAANSRKSSLRLVEPFRLNKFGISGTTSYSGPIATATFRPIHVMNYGRVNMVARPVQALRSTVRFYARKKDPNFPPACQELPDVRIKGIEKPNYQVQPGKPYSMKLVLPDDRKLPIVVYPDQQGQIDEIERLLPNGIVRLTCVQKDVRFQVFWLTSRTTIENLRPDHPPPPEPWTYSAIAAIPERAHGTFFGREADIERMKQEAAAKAEAERKAKEAAEAAAAAAASNPATATSAQQTTSRRKKKTATETTENSTQTAEGTQSAEGAQPAEGTQPAASS